MLYIQRDEDGKLVRVEAGEFDGMSGTLPDDDKEVRAWHSGLEARNSLLQLMPALT